MAVAKKFKVQAAPVTIEEGTQIGIFIGLIHVGMQKSDFKGEISFKDQVLLKFELPDTLLSDGRPVTLIKRETNSIAKKSNLLKVIKALKGGKEVDEVDFEELIGMPLMLDLKTNTKGTGVNITGYMAVPAGLKKNIKPQLNESTLLFDVETISAKELEVLPEWIQKLINERITGDIKAVDEDINY